MSRRDAIVLASRTLAVLLTVGALTDVSYLPERLHSFLHFPNYEPRLRAQLSTGAITTASNSVFL